MTGESSQKLVVGWLYGTKMNIYGDRGNVLAITRRAEWRNIEVEVRDLGFGQPIPPDIDIFFWGGGQDQEQVAVSRDMQGEKGTALRNAIEGGAAMLAICGGYQLLGHEYRPHNGQALPGVGIFDATSVAGPERFIGNVVVNTPRWGSLVGFENHSGLTHLGEGVEALGTVEVGRGNNGQDGTEGAVYKNAIGCYLHGALLPKNPVLTDWLIGAGLGNRYGETTMGSLNDDLERRAHTTAVGRARATR